MALEFDTAVARVLAEDETPEEQPTIEFYVNERDEESGEVVDRVLCHAYEPYEGAVIALMADATGRRSQVTDKVSGMVDFVMDIVDEPTKNYLTRRLLDREDPFGGTELAEIALGLIGEKAGRPTRQPSDFAPSRKTGGQSSTRRTTKSTSSASRQTAS